MRIIKFRAWCGLNEGMCDAFSVYEDGSWAVQQPLLDERFPLMQFTGLLDKNGIEIYEADILRYEIDLHWGDGSVQEHIDRLIEVRYENAAFIAINRSGERDGEWMLLRVANLRNMRVVGNVYENPELLSKSTLRLPDKTDVSSPDA